MANNNSKENHATRRGGTPLAVAIAVAALGILGMLIVDHGPWNKPQVKTAMVANTTTTGDAARDAGATVMPTDPNPGLNLMRRAPSLFTRQILWRRPGISNIASCPRLINLVPDRKLTRLVRTGCAGEASPQLIPKSTGYQ